MDIIEINNEEQDLQIENREFKSAIDFYVNGGKDEKATKLQSVQFFNCTFRGSPIDNETLAVIEDRQIRISFISCHIENRFSFRKLKMNGLIIFLIDTVMNGLYVNHCDIDKLHLSRVLITDKMIVNNSRVNLLSIGNSQGYFIVNDQGEIRVSAHYNGDNLTIERGVALNAKKKLLNSPSSEIKNLIEHPITLSINNVKEFLFHGTHIKTKEAGLRIKTFPKGRNLSEKKLKYFLSEEDLNILPLSITIDQSQGITDKIKLTGLYSKILSLQGNSSSQLILEHIKTDKLYISDFSSKKIDFYDISSRNDTEFTIFQATTSRFSEANFSKVDLDTFSAVNLYRCQLETIRFSSPTFPKEILTIKNIYYPDDKEPQYNSMQYELFRQLRYALNSNYNTVKALEMQDRMFDAAKKDDSLALQDRIILFLNGISNSHGTSIIRAVITSVIVVVFSWLVYCATLPNSPLDYTWEGILEFFRFAISNSELPTIFANPLHKIGDLKSHAEESGTDISTAGLWVSFFSRVLVAWSYYQFVSAFRKFGRAR